MKMHGLTPDPVNRAAQNLPSVNKQDKNLEKACKDFESLFLNQLLTAMRKTIPKNEGENNREKEMFESMMDSEMSKSWAQSDGVGLANVLYQQLKHNKKA